MASSNKQDNTEEFPFVGLAMHNPQQHIFIDIEVKKLRKMHPGITSPTSRNMAINIYQSFIKNELIKIKTTHPGATYFDCQRIISNEIRTYNKKHGTTLRSSLTT